MSFEESIMERIKRGEKPGFHELFPSNDAREKMAIRENIKDYKKQSELAMKELAEVKNQKDVEKRRINEKQIRALRSNYRRGGGFLNHQGLTQVNDNNQNGVTNKLGV